MPFKKFASDDIFYNVIKTYPNIQVDVYNSQTYLQNENLVPGVFAPSVPCVPTGYVSLYEMNVDRNQSETGLIYPFIVKNGTLSNFKTISTTQFVEGFQYGDIISSSYPLSASITREYWPQGAGMLVKTPSGWTLTAGHPRRHLYALENVLNYNKYLSYHYAFSSSLGDKAEQQMALISIPSIFYGAGIKKGTVDLKFYISGSLIGRLQDSLQNGELIQTTGSGYAQSQGSGSTAGVVLYNQGFIILTGSWALENGVTRNYQGGPPLQPSSWIFFGTGIGGHESTSGGEIPPGTLLSSSFRMEFEGTQYVPTITMFANADKAELNYSNNPTYLVHSQSMIPSTGSYIYVEPQLTIKNTVQTPYPDPTGSFKKITYISKIGVYDNMGNLIGIASTATPVKKTEDLDYTFKLKLDF